MRPGLCVTSARGRGSVRWPGREGEPSMKAGGQQEGASAAWQGVSVREWRCHQQAEQPPPNHSQHSLAPHLLHACAVDLSQQRQDQRLLARARRAVEERVRAIARDHLDGERVARCERRRWADRPSSRQRRCQRAPALTSFRRLAATSLCSSKSCNALGRYCRGEEGAAAGQPLAAAGQPLSVAAAGSGWPCGSCGLEGTDAPCLHTASLLQLGSWRSGWRLDQIGSAVCVCGWDRGCWL